MMIYRKAHGIEKKLLFLLLIITLLFLTKFWFDGQKTRTDLFCNNLRHKIPTIVTRQTKLKCNSMSWLYIQCHPFRMSYHPWRPWTVTVCRWFSLNDFLSFAIYIVFLCSRSRELWGVDGWCTRDMSPIFIYLSINYQLDSPTMDLRFETKLGEICRNWDKS